VADLPGELQFAAEPVNHIGIGGDLGRNHLDGDVFVELDVMDAVDAAHAARSELLDDTVPAGEAMTRREDGRHADGVFRGAHDDRRIAIRMPSE